jgi:hypothetical protein
MGHCTQNPLTEENPDTHVLHLVEFLHARQFYAHAIQVVEFNRTYPTVQ